MRALSFCLAPGLAFSLLCVGKVKAAPPNIAPLPSQPVTTTHTVTNLVTKTVTATPPTNGSSTAHTVTPNQLGHHHHDALTGSSANAGTGVASNGSASQGGNVGHIHHAFNNAPTATVSSNSPTSAGAASTGHQHVTGSTGANRHLNQTTLTPLASTQTSSQSNFSIPTNTSLNLGSGRANLVSSNTSTVQIQVGGQVGSNGQVSGGQTVSIAPHQHVTAAQLVAVAEVENNGGQGLLLNQKGVAVGGVAVVTATDSGALRSLTVPTNVTLESVNFTAKDPFDVKGSVNVLGSLLALESQSNVSSIFNLGSLSVGQLGSISGSVPTALSVQYFSTPSLTLNVANSITNLGTISSPGILNISAGHNLVNGNGSLNASPALAQITGQSLNLYSGTGTFVNHGTITASAGDTTFNAPASQNLTLNNSGGSISAINGAINFRDSSYAGSSNISINGGSLAAQQVNIAGGSGAVNANVGSLTGVTNISAGSANIIAPSANLQLGNIQVSKDPTFFNPAGDITLTNSITVGEDLSILASGNILSTPGATINLLTDGHDINLIAGANITTTVGTTTTTVPGAAATADVTISPTGAPGGNIDFSGSTVNLNSSPTGAGNAGNVTLAAFSNGATGGQILFSSGGSITANGSVGASDGNINIIAGATSGVGVITGSLTNDINAGTGQINITTAQPTTSNGLPITYTTTGNITSGNTIVPSATIQNSSVSLNNTVSSSGNTNVTAGGDIAVNAALTANNVNLTSTQGNIIVAGNVTGTTAINLVAKNGSVSLVPMPIPTFVTNIVIDNTPPTALPTDILLNGNIAYVSDRLTDTISIVNLTTNLVIGALPVSGAPGALAIDPTGTFLYVANGNHSLSVYNIHTNSLVTDIPLADAPSGIAITPDGKFVYISLGHYSPTGSIAIVSTASDSVVGSIALPGNGHPVGIAINSAGTLAYVAEQNPNNYLVVNLQTNTVSAVIPNPTTTSTEWPTISPSGNQVYFTNFGSQTTMPPTPSFVTVIDTATNTISSPIFTPHDSSVSAFSPTGYFNYVANTGDGVTPGTVSIIQTSTQTILATLTGAQGVGLNPIDVKINSAGSLLYEVNALSDTVGVFGFANPVLSAPVINIVTKGITPTPPPIIPITPVTPKVVPALPLFFSGFGPGTPITSSTSTPSFSIGPLALLNAAGLSALLPGNTISANDQSNNQVIPGELERLEEPAACPPLSFKLAQNTEDKNWVVASNQCQPYCFGSADGKGAVIIPEKGSVFRATRDGVLRLRKGELLVMGGAKETTINFEQGSVVIPAQSSVLMGSGSQKYTRVLNLAGRPSLVALGTSTQSHQESVESGHELLISTVNGALAQASPVPGRIGINQAKPTPEDSVIDRTVVSSALVESEQSTKFIGQPLSMEVLPLLGLSLQRGKFSTKELLASESLLREASRDDASIKKNALTRLRNIMMSALDSSAPLPRIQAPQSSTQRPSDLSQDYQNPADIQLVSYSRPTALGPVVALNGHDQIQRTSIKGLEIRTIGAPATRQTGDQITVLNHEALISSSTKSNINFDGISIQSSPQTVLLLSKEGSTVKIRNLHERSRGSASLMFEGQPVNLKSGEELMIVRTHAAGSEESSAALQDFVQRRALRDAQTPSGITLSKSEISIASLFGASSLLYELYDSPDKADRGLTGKIVKTAAVLNVATASHGPYSEVTYDLSSRVDDSNQK